MWPSTTSVASTQAITAPLHVHSQLPLPSPADLLAHKYRPASIDTLDCHREQAKRLKQWILEFTNAPKNDDRDSTRASYSSSDSDYEDCGAMSDDSGAEETARKCVLLTGPPGIGKTSLVYVVAKELKMHIVESHPSEKRDFKLFKTLKLANQKGKINPIARLFQMSQLKQQQPLPQPRQALQRNPKRKRRKVDVNEKNDNQLESTQSKCLSLSGNSSILLFDDVDVVFEEDGPFLKSLAEFIKDSKRPVIVTASRSIEHIKRNLVHFEHISLTNPQLDDCARILRDVCRKEKYHKLDKVTNCRIIARKLNCDIRQCLNRIHFYGDRAFDNIEFDVGEVQHLEPEFCRLSEILDTSAPLTNAIPCKEDENEKASIEKSAIPDDEETIIYTSLSRQQEVTATTLECYDTAAIIDLMDRAFDFVDRATLLTRWLEGRPSDRYGAHSCEHTLNEQIRKSIVDLSQELYKKELTSHDGRPQPRVTLRSPVCFTDLKASLGTEGPPLPIASRLRLRPRNGTKQDVPPIWADAVEMFNGY